MKKVVDWFRNPDTRKWIYGIVRSLIPILLLVGWIVPEMSEPLLFLAAALLGLGGVEVASRNINKKTEEVAAPAED